MNSCVIDGDELLKDRSVGAVPENHIASENHAKHINISCRQNKEFFCIMPGGI